MLLSAIRKQINLATLSHLPYLGWSCESRKLICSDPPKTEGMTTEAHLCACPAWSAHQHCHHLKEGVSHLMHTACWAAAQSWLQAVPIGEKCPSAASALFILTHSNQRLMLCAWLDRLVTEIVPAEVRNAGTKKKTTYQCPLVRLRWDNV